MNISVVGNLAVAFITLLLGIAVVSRNVSSTANRSFFALSIVSALWSLAYSFADAPSSVAYANLLNSASHLLSVLALMLVVFFTLSLNKSRLDGYFYGFLCIATLMVVLSPTFLISGRVLRSINGSYNFNYGPYYPAYIIFLLVVVFYILLILNVGIKHQKSLVVKQQNRLMLAGLICSMLIGIFLGAVLPSAGSLSAASDLAPSSLLFFTAFTAFAMVKHRLFDLRLVVARAVAYVLLLSSIVSVFGFFVFYLANLIIPSNNIFVSTKLIPLLAAVLLAVTYQPLKRFFDRVTNRFFFQDAYNSQQLLDKLNKNLVMTTDTLKLSSSTNEIIESEIKPEFCELYLASTEYRESRVIAGGQSHIDSNIVNDIELLSRQTMEKIINIDSLLESGNQNKLAHSLRRRGVGLVVVLSANESAGTHTLGYLVLGHKKSGNIFNGQDMDVIQIVGNELVLALQNALRYEEIANFNVTLQKKVEEATRELKRTNEKLQALDQAKDEFISMASHQLRTPLTSVKGYLSMVLEGDAGDITDNQRQLLAQAFASSQRMVFLIADLLNVSRLRTGKFVIEAKPTYLPDVIQTEINQLQETAASRNLTLVFNKPEKFPLLMLDETKIRQVIMNFTDNALYYTPAGGEVTLKLEELSRSVEFTVVDNGIGVPKREQHHLFNKFYRANNARKARPDGTGLGLFMAKKIIVAQGGAIIFKSVESEGSTFGFTFPKAKLRVGAPASTLH